MLKAAIWVGCTFPGIIDDPGSLAGRINSPQPDLGPDDKNRRSFMIFNNDIDKDFREFEKFTSESWDDNASNLFCEGL